MEKLHNIIKLIFIIPIYLFIFGFVFFVIGLSKVDALVLYTSDNNTQDYVTYGFNGTTRGYIYNCSSTNSCTSLSPGSTMGNGMVYTDSALTNDTNGFRFDYLTSQPMYKDTLYGIRTYYCSENSYSPVVTGWNGVGEGAGMEKNTSYYTAIKAETSISSVIGSLDTGGYFVDYCYSVYQVFEPSKTSSYYGLQLATSSGTNSGRYVLLGHDLEVIGPTDGLTQGQVQEVVQESANEINNNIDEMTDTIDQGLDNVIENQDKNNQELQDTIDKGLQTCRDSLNLIDFANPTRVYGNFTYNNNVLTISGNNSYTAVYYDLIPLARKYPGERLKLDFDSLNLEDYNSTSNVLAQIRVRYTDNTTYQTILLVDGSNFTRLLLSDLSDVSTYELIITANNTSSVIESSLSITKPILHLGNDKVSWEPYGEKVCKSKLDEAEETRKGILQTIRELPQTLINLFLDMLKSLFIPSEEDLNDIIDESTSVTENFGFVGQSYSLVVDLFTSMIDVQQGNACTTLPELTLKFGGILNMEDYTLWEERNVCVSDNEWFGNETPQINIVRTILTIGLVANFLSFAISQIHEILSKEDTKS